MKSNNFVLSCVLCTVITFTFFPSTSLAENSDSYASEEQTDPAGAEEVLKDAAASAEAIASNYDTSEATVTKSDIASDTSSKDAEAVDDGLARTVSYDMGSNNISSSWALLNFQLILSGIAFAVAFAALQRDRKKKPKQNFKVMAASVLALVSPVLFFLTEDLMSKMVYVDVWTILYAAIFIAEASFLISAFNVKEQETEGFWRRLN